MTYNPIAELPITLSFRMQYIRVSEQTAALMFKECRAMFIVDSIDSQLTCVWFS